MNQPTNQIGKRKLSAMTSQKKRISIPQILGIGLLFLIGLYVFNLFYLTPDQRYFKNQFEKMVAEGKTEIAIRDLTDFQWDSVCHLGVYDAPFQERGHVGKFPIKDGVKIPYFTDKSEWGLAFIQDGKVFKAFEVKINPFIRPNAFCLDKASATLEKEKNEDFEFYMYTDIKSNETN